MNKEEQSDRKEDTFGVMANAWFCRSDASATGTFRKPGDIFGSACLLYLVCEDGATTTNENYPFACFFTFSLILLVTSIDFCFVDSLRTLG